MKSILGFSIILCSLLNASLKDTEHYLENRLPEENGRHKTFFSVLELMKERNVQTIVETGTERWQESEYCFDGDGGSTIIFGHWIQDQGGKMYSVDINETHINYCAENTKEFTPNLELVLSDSVAFLQNFSESIDFLYLDSYDYAENNPTPAQDHCLNEIKAAEDKLHSQSIIMIDDCNIPGGGKGKSAIEYLLSKGWILYKNHHQVILVREEIL